ncbi:hypothetical protein SAY86_013233 [Trapa natans]|uniref:Uncharacterized protein n=1 Tax=Trapa natans TaxID=22666 RepID=A0AAN7M0Z1_TRANT|nr:hypothetical protein SAY86_013233 [Trapa natans]
MLGQVISRTTMIRIRRRRGEAKGRCSGLRGINKKLNGGNLSFAPRNNKMEALSPSALYRQGERNGGEYLPDEDDDAIGRSIIARTEVSVKSPTAEFYSRFGQQLPANLYVTRHQWIEAETDPIYGVRERVTPGGPDPLHN